MVYQGGERGLSFGLGDVYLKVSSSPFSSNTRLVVQFCSQGSSEENYQAASRSEILLVILNRTFYNQIPLTKGLCLDLSNCHFLVVSLVQTKYFTRLIS